VLDYSIATGKKIQEMAAKSNLKRVTLELGGKSPAVVFDDCNLENAVTWTANAITANTGQVCFAASRVYVQEGIYDKFIEKYKEAMKNKANEIGDPDAEGTNMGPLVDEAQFKRVQGFIERGQQGQGTLAVGGKRVGDKGFYIEPTVFTWSCPTIPTLVSWLGYLHRISTRRYESPATLTLAWLVSIASV
jgi:aldehyde dehydrogenase (NAD+)